MLIKRVKERERERERETDQQIKKRESIEVSDNFYHKLRHGIHRLGVILFLQDKWLE